MVGVKSVIIEYSDQKHLDNWKKLLPSEDFFDGPNIQFQKGKRNKLIGINIISTIYPVPAPIHLGEFEISFVNERQ